MKTSLSVVMQQSEPLKSQFEAPKKAKDHLYVEATKHILALYEREKEISAALTILRGCMNELDTSLSVVRDLLAGMESHVNLPTLEALLESSDSQGTITSQEEVNTTNE